MKKSISLLAAVAVAGSVLIGGSASAITFPTDCGSGKVCLYDYYDYVTQLGWKGSGVGVTNISATNNDKMASWANNTGTNAAWYTDTYGSGSCFTMVAHGVNPALGLFERDTASSWKTNGGC